MQTLVIGSTAVGLRLCDQINRAGSAVNHRCAENPDIGVDILGVDVRGVAISFSRGNQGLMPVGYAGAGIGVESVYRVTHRGSDDQIVSASPDAHVGDPKRLRVDRAISNAREQLPKAGSV